MSIQLQGAIACVTGGGRGIGYAVAKGLAERGATVWIGDIDLPLAQKAASELGDKVKAAYLDVASADSFRAFIEAAQEDGPISLLVNNAGIMRTGEFHLQDIEGQQREIAINFTGVTLGMRLVLPAMLERNVGHIVNLASMAGKMSMPGASVYTGTKFAVAGMSRAVRTEIAGSNVTITCVFPSAVRTELTDGLDIMGVPTAEPAEVAAAIIDSCKYGQAEITLPGWAKAIGVVEEAMPDKLISFIKRTVGAQRRVSMDNEKRKAYQART